MLQLQSSITEIITEKGNTDCHKYKTMPRHWNFGIGQENLVMLQLIAVLDLYQFGKGVEVDMKKADHYWELAAIKGDVYARNNLGAHTYE